LLANVTVIVGDLPESKRCDYLPGQLQMAIILVSCHPRVYGRYVRVTATESNNKISIYELEVHGLDL